MPGSIREQLPTCRQEATLHGDKYLTCNLASSQTRSSQVAKEVFTFERDPMCEIPSFAHQHAVGLCQFRASNHTTSCGCPELSNPELKKAYQDDVCKTVLRIARRKDDITLTFFASGGLRNECELITLILRKLEENGWEGSLHLQFVDPEYTIDKTQTVVSTQTEVNWEYAIGAGIAGLIAIGAIGAGTQQKKKEHQYACYGTGSVFGIAAIILAANAQQPVTQTRETKQLSIKPPILRAIQGTIETLQAQLPETIELKASYFPNEAACRRANFLGKTDGLFGYDIGGRTTVRVNGKVKVIDSYQDFITLKNAMLSRGGHAILVGKEGLPNQIDTPFYETARGSHSMQRRDWQRH